MAEYVSTEFDSAKENERTFGRAQSAERFAKKSDRGYKSYKNINLNTLDDEELKVYNDRGWAYDLFTDEDFILLNEKIDEFKQGKLSNVYRLLDDSQLFELNNKMVLFSGNRSEPIIYAVMAINAQNEYVAEPIKEIIYNEFGNYRSDKTTCSALLHYVQEIAGNGYARIYFSDSFRVAKRSAEERTRAIFPDDFSNFGYTKYAYGQSKNRGGVKQTGKVIYPDYDSLEYGDRLYFDDVVNHNFEGAQRAVNATAEKAFRFSKVRSNRGSGKLVKVYHWTDSDFTVFDSEKSGSNQGKTHDDGIYVSTNQKNLAMSVKNALNYMLISVSLLKCN